MDFQKEDGYLSGNMSTNKTSLVAKVSVRFMGLTMKKLFGRLLCLSQNRIMLAIAAFHDYEIWQMDVKTAFLNGKLEEEVYMVQHRGFEDTSNSKKVCMLQRAIYGLKQASRSWNKRFDEEVKSLGFIQSLEEPCVQEGQWEQSTISDFVCR